MADGRILILEGADGSGKTTLAKELIRQANATGKGVYVHNGLHKNMWARHLGALAFAEKRAAAGQTVVIDRLWLSECVYGSIFRGQSAFPVAARCFDRVARRLGAIYVMCVPRDSARHLARFEQLKKTRPEYASDVTKVVRYYHDLVNGGNLMWPFSDYLAQWVRRGGWNLREDVVIHDLDQHEIKSLDYVAHRYLSVARQRRARQMPSALSPERPNFTGFAPEAKTVIVGEAPSPRARVGWPFVWSEKPGAAGTFNSILHKLDADETKLAFVNASCDGDHEHLNDVVRTMDKRTHYIALGNVAARRLQELDVPGFASLPHPQWVRRFTKADSDARSVYRFMIQRALNGHAVTATSSDLTA